MNELFLLKLVLKVLVNFFENKFRAVVAGNFEYVVFNIVLKNFVGGYVGNYVQLFVRFSDFLCIE